MISFISSLKIIYVVVPDRNIFLWMTTSVAAAAAAAAADNRNGIKTHLANGLSRFRIKGNPVFGKCPRSLPKNPPDCPTLCN